MPIDSPLSTKNPVVGPNICLYQHPTSQVTTCRHLEMFISASRADLLQGAGARPVTCTKRCALRQQRLLQRCLERFSGSCSCRGLPPYPSFPTRPFVRPFRLRPLGCRPSHSPRQVLDGAVKESKDMGSAAIDPIHILLALLRRLEPRRRGTGSVPGWGRIGGVRNTRGGSVHGHWPSGGNCSWS